MAGDPLENRFSEWTWRWSAADGDHHPRRCEDARAIPARAGSLNESAERYTGRSRGAPLYAACSVHRRSALCSDPDGSRHRGRLLKRGRGQSAASRGRPGARHLKRVFTKSWSTRRRATLAALLRWHMAAPGSASACRLYGRAVPATCTNGLYRSGPKLWRTAARGRCRDEETSASNVSLPGASTPVPRPRRKSDCARRQRSAYEIAAAPVTIAIVGS